MSASAPAFRDHADFAAYVERYGPRLLLWIWDRAEGEPGRQVSCAEFGSSQSIPVSAVRAVVEHLGAEELIDFRSGPGTDAGAPVVTLRAAGAERARRLQALRANSVQRGRHATRAVLHWIHANPHRQPLRISGFLDSPDVFFLGEPLSRSEVARALTYLAEEELITCEGPPFHNNIGSHVALTSQGVSAVLSGSSDIVAYVAQQRERRRPAQHTHIEAGTIGHITQGDSEHHVRNSVEVHTALTPAELARLIEELAPGLHLAPEARAALLRSAAALARGGNGGGGDDGNGDDGDDGPGPDRQRGLMESMRRLLGGAPDTVGRQLLLDAVGQALGRLLGS
ncbi:hypothetical protein GL263_06045 [Streptomyces durbertensis]|uniref:Uncharacterized protein n=1 Tax=Streptomyces durbertensis TaxID=2448886 RepID=A0ABR6ECS6_9ACTN|nr:hypothetical protein [Streptomyces durbertensis]MBB1243130.1 hypothetical protein [Streptomyces durbertensis]